MAKKEQKKAAGPAKSDYQRNVPSDKSGLFLKYQLWLALIIVVSLIISVPLFLHFHSIEHARAVSEIIAPLAMVVVGFYFGQRPVEAAEKRAEDSEKKKSEAVAEIITTADLAEKVLQEKIDELDIKRLELEEIGIERDYFAELLRLAVYGSVKEKEEVKEALDTAKVF